jgi:WD40 repeat protein
LAGQIIVYNQSFALVTSFSAHTGHINRIKQSPFQNGDLVASCSNDNFVKVWNISVSSNWTQIQTFTGHANNVNAVEWIDEEMISSGSLDGTIKIWSIRTSQINRTIITGATVFCMKLLVNGIYLASGLANSIINIYNINDGSLIVTLLGHTNSVMDLVQVNLDLLASASDDFNVKIWNLATNSIKFTLRGHTAQACGLKQISAEILASGSNDHTIKLWNLTSGSLIRNLSGHSDVVVWSIDVLSDLGNSFLVNGAYDQTIKIWNYETGACLRTVNAGIQIKTLTVLNPTESTPISAIENLFLSLFSNSSNTNMTQFLAILANQKGDLNACLQNCSSSGVCTLRNGLIGCQCFAYFTGSSCQFDTRPCSSGPCLNNATCTDSLNVTFASFECQCQPTFHGPNCENQIDICQNVTCNEHGYCFKDQSEAKCKCFTRYSGDECDIVSTYVQLVQSVQLTSSIICFVTLGLVVLLVIVNDVFNYLTARREKARSQKNRKRVVQRFMYYN